LIHLLAMTPFFCELNEVFAGGGKFFGRSESCRPWTPAIATGLEQSMLDVMAKWDLRANVVEGEERLRIFDQGKQENLNWCLTFDIGWLKEF
jgi:hypothetical protein